MKRTRIDELFGQNPRSFVSYNSGFSLSDDILGSPIGEARLLRACRTLQNGQIAPEEVHCTFAEPEGKVFYMSFGIHQHRRNPLFVPMPWTWKFDAYSSYPVSEHHLKVRGDQKNFEGVVTPPKLSDCARILQSVIDCLPQWTRSADSCYAFAYLLFFALTQPMLGALGSEGRDTSPRQLLDQLDAATGGQEVYHIGNERTGSGTLVAFRSLANQPFTLIAVFGGAVSKLQADTTLAELEFGMIEVFLQSERGRRLLGMKSPWATEASTSSRRERLVKDILCRYVLTRRKAVD